MNWTTLSVGGVEWKLYKEYRRAGGPCTFGEWAVDAANRIDHALDKVRWLRHSEAVAAMRVDGCAHYFVDAGVCAFARHAVKNSSDHARDDSFFMKVPFALHFPTSEQSCSWFIGQPSDEQEYVCHVTAGSMCVELNRRSIGHLYSCDDTPESEHRNQFEDVWRLLFGLSLYVQAFPDCVTEMQTKALPWLQGPRRMIGRHAIIDEEESRSVSPHFRRGHFRVLQSERYHEPGKVVFVKGTFVKGRAYHVETAPEAEQLLCA